MNKNLAIAIGVIVVIVLAGVVMVPALFPPKTSMTVTFYDADDNVVWSEKTDYGLFEFAFIHEGNIATKVRVDIDWVCSDYEADSVLAIQGTLDIEAVVGGYDPVDGSAGSSTWSSTGRTEPTGNMWTEFTLADFIDVDFSSGKYYGWGVTVTATLEATEKAPDGTLRGTATPWSDNLFFYLSWEEDVPDEVFTIVGQDFGFTPS